MLTHTFSLVRCVYSSLLGGATSALGSAAAAAAAAAMAAVSSNEIPSMSTVVPAFEARGDGPRRKSSCRVERFVVCCLFN